MKLLRTLMVAALLLVPAMAVPTAASAADWSPFVGIDCSSDRQTNDSAVCQDGRSTSDNITGPQGIVLRIANFVALLSSAIAVVIIILAGLRMVTANGGKEDVAAARRTLIYAAVGLVIVVIARMLVAFIILRL